MSLEYLTMEQGASSDRFHPAVAGVDGCAPAFG